MGPGSFDPGNALFIKREFRQRPASMGPGSFDPGNAERPSTSPSKPACFNGAGVF